MQIFDITSQADLQENLIRISFPFHVNSAHTHSTNFLQKQEKKQEKLSKQ